MHMVYVGEFHLLVTLHTVNICGRAKERDIVGGTDDRFIFL